MRGIILGIKKHPWRTVGYFFASFSVLWTLIEGLTYFLLNFDLRGAPALGIIILVGIVYTACMMNRPLEISFLINHSNTTIRIKFSDLFREEGFRVIPVNEFFDSELGLPVSEKSLHGLFITRCLGGHRETFDQIISDELSKIRSEVEGRSEGKTKKYPIGTTAVVPVNTDKYLCFALCNTDTETCKARADVPILWKALDGLYDKARVALGGDALVLPLVGSGLSGIGLPSRDLLDLIILSIITATKRQQITTRIKIILTAERFEEIDLADVRRHWR